MKYFLTLFSLFLFNFSFCQTGFQIDGSIENLPGVKNGLKDGDTVRLAFSSNDLSIPAIIKNNRFTIIGEIVEPAVAMLEFKGSGAKLLIDNSLYSTRLNQRNVGKDLYTYEALISTRSQFHNTWITFVKTIKELYEKKKNYLNQKDLEQSVEAKRQFQDKIANIDSLINAQYQSLAINHSDNPASAYLLPSAPDFSYLNYNKAYDKLSFKVRNSFFGKQLFEKLELIKQFRVEKDSNLLNSRSFPSINVIDTSGRYYLLDTNFFKSSKYTLIDFWASWCAPCRLMNIELRAKESEYRKEGLKIVGFSLDNNLAPWKKAIADDKIGWSNYSDLKAINSPLAVFLNLTQIPANILIDERGRIVARDVYGSVLEDLLKRSNIH